MTYASVASLSGSGEGVSFIFMLCPHQAFTKAFQVYADLLPTGLWDKQTHDKFAKFFAVYYSHEPAVPAWKDHPEKTASAILKVLQSPPFYLQDYDSEYAVLGYSKVVAFRKFFEALGLPVVKEEYEEFYRRNSDKIYDTVSLIGRNIISLMDYGKEISVSGGSCPSRSLTSSSGENGGTGTGNGEGSGSTGGSSGNGSSGGGSSGESGSTENGKTSYTWFVVGGIILVAGVLYFLGQRKGSSD